MKRYLKLLVVAIMMFAIPSLAACDNEQIAEAYTETAVEIHASPIGQVVVADESELEDSIDAQGALNLGGLFIKRSNSFIPLVGADIPYRTTGGNVIKLDDYSFKFDAHRDARNRTFTFKEGDELVYFSSSHAPNTFAAVEIVNDGFTAQSYFFIKMMGGEPKVSMSGYHSNLRSEVIEEINGQPAIQFSQYAKDSTSSIDVNMLSPLGIPYDYMLHGSQGETFLIGSYSGTAWITQEVVTDIPYLLFRSEYCVHTLHVTSTREGYALVEIPPEVKNLGAIAIFAQDFDGGIMTGRFLSGRSNFILKFE